MNIETMIYLLMQNTTKIKRIWRFSLVVFFFCKQQSYKSFRILNVKYEEFLLRQSLQKENLILWVSGWG